MFSPYHEPTKLPDAPKYYDELSPALKEAASVRGIVIESGHHNFNYWIPSVKYHASHPEFFAYVNYCSPAPGFRLTPNLAVHFAPYWRCINHEISDSHCPVNSRYAQDILNWCHAKSGGEINIYEYYMGVNFYLSLPMIHFREMFHELQWYQEKVIGSDFSVFCTIKPQDSRWEASTGRVPMDAPHPLGRGEPFLRTLA